ncbi:MAG: hypothetical protein K2Z80_00085, partial [Xanthobacteraceae bacterium]|nr:hypothetical protein [Xanthobacteraceae bacterium]
MGCRARFFVYFALLIVEIFFPLAATAQTGNSTEVSDKAFLAVIKARDDKLILVTELNQIKVPSGKWLEFGAARSPITRGYRFRLR